MSMDLSNLECMAKKTVGSFDKDCLLKSPLDKIQITQEQNKYIKSQISA